MKYNLEMFDKIINDILNNTDLIFGEKEFNFNSNLLTNENIRIKLSIKNIVFKQNSNSKIEHFIHKQQLALENLITIVVKEINPKKTKDLYSISNNYNQIDNLKIIYDKLEKLQLFIEADYSGFLNLNSRAPYRSLVKQKNGIASKVKMVRKSLLSVGLQNDLLLIVLEPLKINEVENVTYNQFNYYSQFITGLHELLNGNNRNFSEESIISLLVELNHNSKIFFEFQVREIATVLKDLETFNSKIDYLILTMKKYFQTNTTSSNTYSHIRPSNTEQITAWIEEEINYLNKKHFLENPTAVLMQQTANKIKLQWDLSVAQLSYFYNLLHTTGIIQNKNQSDIFRNIAENNKTAKVENISVDSISAKYYNVETSTKEAVKSVIINLLNLVNK
ncbi:hypothetical protein [Flavobacterium sp.]|uniref:hypothetical protein n=1 Tax=Flavobacterium sp. TaxID=239 RepID=UPI0037524288